VSIRIVGRFVRRDRVPYESIASPPDRLNESWVVGIIAKSTPNGRDASGYGRIADGFGLPDFADQLHFGNCPLVVLNQVEKKVKGFRSDGDRLAGARKTVKAHIKLEDIKSIERHLEVSRSLPLDSSAEAPNSLY
jgi:hypothetical protein